MVNNLLHSIFIEEGTKNERVVSSQGALVGLNDHGHLTARKAEQ